MCGLYSHSAWEAQCSGHGATGGSSSALLELGTTYANERYTSTNGNVRSYCMWKSGEYMHYVTRSMHCRY